ncbi:hypothetical protein CVT26_012167 [Gymnopilus dilepis]|uniref:F-box domain-containing protein n=1 Tax=Gymnopilus dilepis TaxID=231916 RepID=A0A409WNN7_9AGAR|nr:hypothetical protein CVT26_012167 [Gymnopilus dilepis]
MFELPATTDNFFFSLLSPADLLRYSRISRSAYKAVSSYIRRTFTIEHVLSRFFDPLEIKMFRQHQSRTGMFISGSTALQFFNRETYADSDLDLYVEHRYSEMIALWLLSIGYTFVPRPKYQAQDLQVALAENMAYDNVHFTVPNQTDAFFASTSMGYFGRGVANVYNFTKSNPPRKIQLITSFHCPLEVILHFHSTCVMNVITHEAAYSLYPYATFEQKRSLIISTEGSKQDSARAKYAERGWEMVGRLSQNEIGDSSSAFAQGERYLGDSRCWKIPILPKLDLPESFIEVNTWSLKYNTAREGVMAFKILLTDHLRYSYVIVDESMQNFLTPTLLGPEEDGQCVVLHLLFIRLLILTTGSRFIDRYLLQSLNWKRELS